MILPADAWGALRPLPEVAPRHRDRAARRWDGTRDRCAAGPQVPLRITADLVTPVLPAETGLLHLDSVLSWAALTAHPVESHTGPAAVVPLPLGLAWVSASGLPLWACTPLRVAGPATPAQEYFHKRYPGHRAEFGDRMNAVTTAGRWKEYRVPVHGLAASQLQADCIGDPDALRRLLDLVTHIGRKGSMGYGRVGRWTITEGSATVEQILAARAVPVAYFAGREPAGVLSLNRAWTAPYWYAPWWADCLVPPT